MPKQVPEENVQLVGEWLKELEEIGIIEEYDRCPGVPVFDVWPTPDKCIQIEVL